MRILPSELRFGDYFVAGVIGAVVTTLLTVWSYPGLMPEIWTDAAVAAQLIPPDSPLPGVWRALVSLLYRFLDAATVAEVLRWAGRISGGLIAAFGYVVLNEAMPPILRYRMRWVDWSRWLVRLTLSVGSLFLACSEPVWRATQAFSPATLAFLLTLVGIWMFIRFLQTGRMGLAYAVMIVCGLLAADSPAGFIYAGVAWWLTYINALGERDDKISTLANPVVRSLSLRRMTVCFATGLAAGVIVNVSFFVAADGMAAHDWSGLDLFTHYFYSHWLSVIHAASWVGWLFALAFAVAPLLLAFSSLGRATNDDAILPYRYGLLYIVIGAISFLQLAGWRAFWFWTWIKLPVMVQSGYVLCLCAFLSALTLAYALSVLLVEIYFRNNRRILDRRFADALEDPAGRRAADSIATTNVWRRGLAWIVVLGLLGATVPFRQKTAERRMLDVIDAYLDETAAECRNLRVLFTDGALDAGVELRALERGHRVLTLPMLNTTSRQYRGVSGRYLLALRQRAALDDEDRQLMEADSATALRTWVGEKTNRLEGVAVQLGFELWKRIGRRMPRGSGVMVVPRGLDDTEAKRARTVVQGLGKEILSVYDLPYAIRKVDRTVAELFMFVQWRLSSIAKYRADEFDRAGDAERALEETRLAESLDEKNDKYKELRRRMDWYVAQRNSGFTPREGLRLGIERADFMLARSFAQQVLRADPNDTQANFAMGMSYFTEEQYVRADAYLRRVLEKRPNDIAVLNNLTVIAIRQGHVDAALEYSERAIKIAPNIPDIKKIRAAALTLDAKRKAQESFGKAKETPK